MSVTVDVKSKPRGPIKGQYQVELMDDRMFLRKKGHAEAITILVGTEAACDKKATITLMKDDTQLSLRVLGIGVKNQRLAEDLTAYLNKEREAPNIEEYKVPGYLVGLSMLPAAIPIMTLGGAIPAVIGAGLVFTNLGIAKNDSMSTSVKTISILAISVVSIGVFIGIVVAVAANQPRM